MLNQSIVELWFSVPFVGPLCIVVELLGLLFRDFAAQSSLEARSRSSVTDIHLVTATLFIVPEGHRLSSRAASARR
ncbi:MAG: hypothetical protein GX147_04135 [Deltaproteobacteria bacterium]|nr:hypothetical protein [Deltaproteobacteria bacterium]